MKRKKIFIFLILSLIFYFACIYKNKRDELVDLKNKKQLIEESLELYKKNYIKAYDENIKLKKRSEIYELILTDYLFNLELKELKKELIKIYDVRAGIDNIEIKKEINLSKDSFMFTIIRNKEIMENVNNLFRYNGQKTIYTGNDFDIKFIGLNVLEKRENETDIIYKISIDKKQSNHYIEFSKSLSELLEIDYRKIQVNCE